MDENILATEIAKKTKMSESTDHKSMSREGEGKDVGTVAGTVGIGIDSWNWDGNENGEHTSVAVDAAAPDENTHWSSSNRYHTSDMTESEVEAPDTDIHLSKTPYPYLYHAKLKLLCHPILTPSSNQGES